jgi:uncharacterized protein
MRHAGLIVKGTRLCNLRCTYCHDWRAGPEQTMSFPIMARMIAAALRDPEHDSVQFIWHGGETMVLPISFYQRALVLQSLFRRPGQIVSNAIQTNGTRLTTDWVQFLRENRFAVGLSLDGPPEVHDRYRRYASGRPSFGDVAQGIRLLQEHGVPFVVLMVIDEAALELGPDAVFDFFLQYGIKSYGLIAAKPTNQPDAAPGTPTEHYTSPVKMTAFLARLYDRWREHGDPTIRIRDLMAIRNRLAGEGAGFCTLTGGCLGRYYLIETNGDVAHCDLFLGDPRYTLGNVRNQGFAELRQSANLLALQAENERALEPMRGCPEFGVCNGWCPHERYLSARHNVNHRAECCGLRDLITHVRSRMTEERATVAAPAAATATHDRTRD